MPRPTRQALAAAVLPLVIGIAAMVVRDARGPSWLGSNQDPTYAYLIDSLRLAIGVPPQLVEHPGTPAQLTGAAGARLVYALSGVGDLVADLVADPERYVRAIGSGLLGLNLAAIFLCGWTAWRATGRFAACAIVQAVPFLSAPAVKHMTDLRPEPLLLLLSAGFLTVTLRALSRAEPSSHGAPAALGIICGLAVATKLTALPLAVTGLLLVGPKGRRRFTACLVLTGLLALVPALPRIGTTFGFLFQSLTGSGVYGSGLLPGAYWPTLLRLAPLLLLPLGGVIVSLAAARRPSPDARGAALRRSLIAFSLGQAVAIGLVLLQPHGGSRYLLPAFGLFGGNIVLILETTGWFEVQSARRQRLVLAGVAGAIGLALASVALLRAELAQLQLEQRGASAAAEHVGNCLLVRYHKASAPAAALVFSQVRGAADERLLAALENRYPTALFLGYFDQTGTVWSHVPMGARNVPRFMGFRGPVRIAPGRCVAFQGSTSGPGRVFETGGFKRESLPLAGHAATLYRSSTEAVYEVVFDAVAAARLEQEAPQRVTQ